MHVEVVEKKKTSCLPVGGESLLSPRLTSHPVVFLWVFFSSRSRLVVQVPSCLARHYSGPLTVTLHSLQLPSRGGGRVKMQLGVIAPDTG